MQQKKVFIFVLFTFPSENKQYIDAQTTAHETKTGK